MSDLTRMGLTALLTTFLVMIVNLLKIIAEAYGLKIVEWRLRAKLLLLVVSVSFVLIIWGDKL